VPVDREPAERPWRLPLFDRSRLRLRPLAERQHDLDLSVMHSPTDPAPDAAAALGPRAAAEVETLAERIVAARARGSAVICLLGGHVIRAGMAPLLVHLLRRGLLTHVAGNGAVAIHDFEFALIGATTESVARYIREGQFGLWEETGWINEVAAEAAREGLGFGQALGRAICCGMHGRTFPYAHLSLLAGAYLLHAPCTIHVSIGQDIIHEHPNFDAAAAGAATYTDFLALAQSVAHLEGGVLLNIGSAVMGPEVYLKALAMARNVAGQEGRQVRHFTTAVFDLLPLEGDYHQEPPKSDPRYYYRPWKTILVRTVADGGESFYIRGDHRDTVPALYHALRRRTGGGA